MIASASPHEVRLVEPTLDACFVSEMPVILIGDKAYDSDPWHASLSDRGIDRVAPYKKNRKRPATQDGRRLRRYKQRFKVERCFAWLEDFRRLVVRWEYHAANYLGFLISPAYDIDEVFMRYAVLQVDLRVGVMPVHTRCFL